jgi:hypothetical protein
MNQWIGRDGHDEVPSDVIILLSMFRKIPSALLKIFENRRSLGLFSIRGSLTAIFPASQALNSHHVAVL